MERGGRQSGHTSLSKGFIFVSFFFQMNVIFLEIMLLSIHSLKLTYCENRRNYLKIWIFGICNVENEWEKMQIIAVLNAIPIISISLWMTASSSSTISNKTCKLCIKTMILENQLAPYWLFTLLDTPSHSVMRSRQIFPVVEHD